MFIHCEGSTDVVKNQEQKLSIENDSNPSKSSISKIEYTKNPIQKLIINSRTKRIHLRQLPSTLNKTYFAAVEKETNEILTARRENL